MSPPPFGYEWHLDPDGGAVYPSADDGGWVYASNSEDTPGGVGALRFDADGNLIDAYSILEGTRNNCAGGQTPWGTWLSCEETTGGQVHECDPFGSAATAVRKPALGSFPHEAVAIDPIHHACYMTEDGGNQRFWRFVSDESDLSDDNGVTRMALESGTLQVLTIEGFEDGGYPDAADARSPRPVTWETVDIDTSGRVVFPTFQNDETTQGTRFVGGAGIWYYEIPEALRQTPAGGSVPTRGVMFFATKGDNRVWAYDIENQLIEIIYDNDNMQMETGFDQVDNVVVSPSGDAMVAEDGSNMRLAIVLNNQPSKLLMQITAGNSEITGPAFTADGSRLYFSRQNGPNVPGSLTRGTTYEMTIPPAFRSIQKADAFSFIERDTGAPATTITSEPVIVSGFLGSLTVSIGLVNGAQFSVDESNWTNLPSSIKAGQSLRVRHTSAALVGEVAETLVIIGSLSPASLQKTTFRTTTSAEDTRPDDFDFGMIEGVPGSTLIESSVITLSGFNMPVPIKCGPHCEYRIDGGNWTDAKGSLAPYQTLQMRHVSNKSSNSVRRTHLHVGDVPGHFATRTG